MGTANVYALVALLASFCYLSTAVPTAAPDATPPSNSQAVTPDGKVFVYKYFASVAVGQNEPAPFASKFQIRGKLIYMTEPNSIKLKFHNLEHAIYNGREDAEVHGKFLSLDNEDIYKPVEIVYKKHNKLEGVKLDAEEVLWSKNIKRSLASLFHVDRTGNGSYHRVEDTGYGKCKVDYMVQSNLDGKTVVEKGYEPRYCSHFVNLQMLDFKGENCIVPAEEDLATVARKVYTFGSVKDVTGDVLERVFSHEKMSYLPWSHRNYGVQYIETIQTLEFEKVADKSEFELNSDGGTLENIKFVNPVDEPEYISDEPKDLIAKVKTLLIEMVDFMRENRIDIDEPNPKHKYLLESLYKYLGSLDKDSLRYLFDHFTTTEKGKITRQIFLGIVPHVGNQVVWSFVKDIIEDEKEDIDMDDETRLALLRKLPLYVETPTVEFAELMEGYANLYGSAISYKVKGAGVLCYSILLRKVIDAHGGKAIPKGLEKYVNSFYDRVKYENTYKNKILYIMALRNIGVDIYKYLAPIVKGEDIFYVDVMIEKCEKYRIAAMWAVAKSISHDYDKTYDLFWPILTNSSLPLSMRITAYELLVPRNPLLDMRILIRVHELMSTERDEHLFNYHYTTLKSNVESTSPCMQLHAENMRKVLHMTKPRKVLSAALSTANVHDYYDTMYGHGKTFRMAAEINEATGIPQNGYYEVVSTHSRRPKLTTGYYWNVDGINLNTIVEMSKNIDLAAHISTGITNENIRKILRQTQGYKLYDKHIHVELWQMDNGYVTNIYVYFENGLTDLLRELTNKYKPDFDRLMDIEQKYNIDTLDISYFNHYKMSVATEMGFPVVFSNDIPYVSHTKLKSHLYPQKNIAMRVEFDTRFHKHSVYQMMVRNPILDIVHSVKRRIVADFALPIDVTFSFQMPSQALKLELPRLANQFLVAGLKIHSFDEVVITKDINNHLKTHCPTCQNRSDITNGPTHKNANLEVLHHLDSGLEFTYGTFDCEHDFEPGAETQEWYRIFNSPKNSWKHDIFAKLWMIIDQGILNYVNNPYTSTCGVIAKVAPCTMHPASHVEMNMRASTANIESQTKLIIRGNVEVKSAKSNKTMRNWEIDLSTELSRYLQAFTAELTRKIPEEKDLKICVEAIKAYPKLVADVSKMEYKTHGKVTFKMGHSDNDECATDVIDIKADITGERLQEQIEDMKYYVKLGSCFKNASNPLDLDIMKPFDWNCLYQAVKSSTMRSYTVDISYGEMPTEYYAKFQMIEDWLRSLLWPQITYRPEHTEKGHAKIYMTYPASKNYGNLTFVNPYYTWELVDVVYEEDEVENRQNDLVFDNTVFPTQFLVDFYKDDIRPCIAHAHELINDMNHTISMEFKDWTLMSGDHGLMSYAIFVKTVSDDKVAVRIYVPDHVIEVNPGEAKPVVTVDGVVIPFEDEEILLPSFDITNYKVSTVNKLIVIETERFSKVKVYYTSYNVIVMPHIILDRNVDGVCGHMGTTVYTQQVPLVYGSA